MAIQNILQVFNIAMGKNDILNDILDVLPWTDVYCELFGGCGTILLNKPVSKIEVFNNKNDQIVNFLKVLQNNSEELIYRLSLTPYSRKEFTSAFETASNETDSIEKARKFFVTFEGGGSILFKFTGTTWVEPYVKELNKTCNKAYEFKTHVDMLIYAAERLRTVYIENKDWTEIIKQYDSEQTTFYCDPLYPYESENEWEIYRGKMTDEEHIALADVLKKCKGYVLISTYENKLYNELYKDWTKLTKQCSKGLSRDRKQTKETLFANYTPVIKKAKLTIERLISNNRQIPLMIKTRSL